jgi:serine/threonine-protein kinase SRPK3
MELLGSNIQDTQEALQGGFIPVSTVKRILRHLLLGIAQLHECGIAHTGMFKYTIRNYDDGLCFIADIKPDNIMINLESRWTTEAIDAWVSENPPRTCGPVLYVPERSLNNMVSAFASQSFPQPTLDALASCNFKFADFSSGMFSESHYYYYLLCVTYVLRSAQFVSDQTMDDITPLGLRPPEVVLGGEWNESVDIWTFGCMVS